MLSPEERFGRGTGEQEDAASALNWIISQPEADGNRVGLSGYSFGAAMGEDGPDVGEIAPDFTLKGIDGKEVTLSSFKDTKPVVLIFGSCT